MKSIFTIDEDIADLGEKEKKVVESIYKIDSSETVIKIPESFEEKALGYLIGDKKNNTNEKEIARYLGSIKNQKIIKIVNKWTYESALYNYLRAYRPGVNIHNQDKLESWKKDTVDGSKKGCDFCDPIKYTPEDSIGRIHGRHCLTAANLAKFDRFHSLLIFKKHNPLDFSEEELSDYIGTALLWFSKVSKIAPEYRYPLLLWNCLPKAGASQVHGHMQMLIADEIYPRMKHILSSGMKFDEEFKVNYFDALVEAHGFLDLLIETNDIKILFYLTPVKEREILIISNSISDAFIGILYKILRKYIDELLILSFNLSIYGIPVGNKGKYIYLSRIVDRGNVLSKTSDIASMELYASPVIAHDPAKLKKELMDLW